MPVKYFDWDDAKNAKLRTERGIGFEDVGFHIERGDLRPCRSGPGRQFPARPPMTLFRYQRAKSWSERPF
jgi:hypothetical protein